MRQAVVPCFPTTTESSADHTGARRCFRPSPCSTIHPHGNKGRQKWWSYKARASTRQISPAWVPMEATIASLGMLRDAGDLHIAYPMNRPAMMTEPRLRQITSVSPTAPAAVCPDVCCNVCPLAGPPLDVTDAPALLSERYACRTEPDEPQCLCLASATPVWELGTEKPTTSNVTSLHGDSSVSLCLTTSRTRCGPRASYSRQRSFSGISGELRKGSRAGVSSINTASPWHGV